MKISKVELVVGLSLGVIWAISYFYDYFPICLLLGFIFGGWIITRGGETAVEGLKESTLYLGLREYDAGVISSLASNMPELVLGVLLIYEGLTEIAILSVIIASGFNVLLLSFLIILVSWNKGEIEIPYSKIAHESDLIRMSILICTLIFALGLISRVSPPSPHLPKEMGVFLLITYLAYLGFLLKVSKRKKEEQEAYETKKEGIDPKKAVFLLALGFVAIFIGGEAITESVELVLFDLNLTVITMAMILGALGSVPEHGIALIGARKGLTELGLGNLLAGISQSILVVFGVIALIVPIPLGGYILFQLMAVAASLWMVKKSILDDGRLTLDEGIFILILQILLFTMLEELAFI